MSDEANIICRLLHKVELKIFISYKAVEESTCLLISLIGRIVLHFSKHCVICERYILGQMVRSVIRP